MNSTAIMVAIEHIGQSPWLNITAFIIGFIGIAIGAYSIMNKRERLPRYRMSNYNIIKDLKINSMVSKFTI
jgi:hypothetical protein